MEHRESSRRVRRAEPTAPAGRQDNVVRGRPIAERRVDEVNQCDLVGDLERHASISGGGSGHQWQQPEPECAGDVRVQDDVGLEPAEQRSESTAGRWADRRRPLDSPQTGIHAAEILDGLTTGVVLVSADGNVQRLNASAETVLGISAALARGKSFYTLSPAFEGFRELLQRALTNRQSFGQQLSMPSPLRDGTMLDLAVRVTPLTDTDARDLLVIELIDATQRHQIDRENALITQHGVSRRMISQLAHEIRNPLGGLRGAAQLLERELPGKELREFTQIIIGEADRLDALMDSLLGPVGKLHRETVNLHELLEHVAVLVETEAGEGFVVQRDYDPSLPAMRLDKNRLIQALLNLARNAVQATGAAGKILFRTRVLTNTVVGQERHRLVASIDIEDDGPGVPDEIADTIFYPLVSGRDDGTGLGLPLAQDLVSRHDGLIEYQSEPGRTVFMVRLPIEEDPDSPPAGTAFAGGGA